MNRYLTLILILLFTFSFLKSEETTTNFDIIKYAFNNKTKIDSLVNSDLIQKNKKDLYIKAQLTEILKEKKLLFYDRFESSFKINDSYTLYIQGFFIFNYANNTKFILSYYNINNSNWRLHSIVDCKYYSIDLKGIKDFFKPWDLAINAITKPDMIYDINKRYLDIDAIDFKGYEHLKINNDAVFNSLQKHNKSQFEVLEDRIIFNENTYLKSRTIKLKFKDMQKNEYIQFNCFPINSNKWDIFSIIHVNEDITK